MMQYQSDLRLVFKSPPKQNSVAYKNSSPYAQEYTIVQPSFLFKSELVRVLFHAPLFHGDDYTTFQDKQRRQQLTTTAELKERRD